MLKVVRNIIEKMSKVDFRDLVARLAGVVLWCEEKRKEERIECEEEGEKVEKEEGEESEGVEKDEEGECSRRDERVSVGEESEGSENEENKEDEEEGEKKEKCEEEEKEEEKIKKEEGSKFKKMEVGTDGSVKIDWLIDTVSKLRIQWTKQKEANAIVEEKLKELGIDTSKMGELREWIEACQRETYNVIGGQEGMQMQLNRVDRERKTLDGDVWDAYNQMKGEIANLRKKLNYLSNEQVTCHFMDNTCYVRDRFPKINIDELEGDKKEGKWGDNKGKGTSWYDRDDRNKSWNYSYKSKDGVVKGEMKKGSWSSKGGGWSYAKADDKANNDDESNEKSK